MIQLYFRVLTGLVADFISDLNAFCAANGYDLLFPDGVLASVQFQGITRFDFVAFEIGIPTLDGQGNIISTDDRGLHVNVSVEMIPGTDPVLFETKRQALHDNLAAWFSQTFVNTAPVAFPGSGGQTWPSTGKTVWITTPIANQKMIGA